MNNWLVNAIRKVFKINDMLGRLDAILAALQSPFPLPQVVVAEPQVASQETVQEKMEFAGGGDTSCL